jgi:hypothetical protein
MGNKTDLLYPFVVKSKRCNTAIVISNILDDSPWLASQDLTSYASSLQPSIQNPV